MRQFRYRTTALTGPWRPDFAAAVEDAARAGQILCDQEKKTQDFRWIVPGKIEEQDETDVTKRSRA